MALATHLIVDGYNLIGEKCGGRLPPSWELEDHRKSLLRALSWFKKVKGLKVTVVFDGAGPGNSEESFWGVKVVYAGGKAKADGAIEAFARKTPHCAIVATSDGSVAKRCREMGAATISSRDLWRKISSLESPWKMEDEDEEEEGVFPKRGTEKRGPARRAPKRERRERRRIDKL